MTRLYGIDFLKFIFIIIILLSHLITPWALYTNTFTQPNGILPNAIFSSQVVIFYFFISIFLLISKCETNNESTVKYTIKRYLQFLPMIILNFVFAIMLYLLNVFETLNIKAELLNFIIINNMALPLFDDYYGYNGGMWFLCVLFWASCGMHFLVRKIKPIFLNFILPVLFIISLYFNLTIWNTDITCKCTIGLITNATCGITLGYFLAQYYKKYNKEMHNTAFKTFLYSVAEICFLGLLLYISIFAHSSVEKLLQCFLFVVITLLFIKPTGIISKFVNHKWAKFLGDITFTIYVSNIFVIYILHKFVWLKYYEILNQHPYFTITSTIIICIVFSIIIHYLFIDKINKIIHTQIKKAD